MSRDDVQVVVLAGGLGTRLGEAGRQCPKVLQPVGGRPFLDILLGLLLGKGFRRFCFCLGHLADQVIVHIDRNWPWLAPSFHVDREPPGTGGSLYAARELLDDTFVVVMGDTYLDIEYQDVLDRLRSPALGVMAVTDAVTDVPANVEIAAGRVIRYDKAVGVRAPWVDTGVLALRRPALNQLAGTELPVDLGVLFQRMILRRALLAHPVRCPFYDIGTPDRLARFADSRTSSRTGQQSG